MDRGAKIITAVVGIVSVLGTVTGIVLWVGGRAGAAEVGVIRSRVSVLEQQRTDETEWRRWLADQVGRISLRIGAPVSPPPPQTLEPRPPDDAPKVP